MYEMGDTIAAVATPSGVGGIGIIRVSGPKALSVAQVLFKTKKPIERKRQILLGKIQDPETGEALDEGLLLVMPKPKSFTAEDVVEFHVHGSPSLLQAVMNLFGKQGVRTAYPGEFTYRAYQNGRLDLTQAEAVEALVSSQGEASRRQAVRHLTGGLAAYLEPVEEALKSLYLNIEARMEFSEEGIGLLDLKKFLSDVQTCSESLNKLIESYKQGKVLQDGLVMALVGPPNSGKSSLLNALLGRQRSIVTSEPGTTRDVIEGEIWIKGTKFRFFDTAGLRESTNPIEMEGIRRSKALIEEADILLWIVDTCIKEESLELLSRTNLAKEKTWIVFNKIDLLPGFNLQNVVDLKMKCFAVSCLTGEGLNQVMNAMETVLDKPLAGENILVTSARHHLELVKTGGCLERLRQLIQSGTSSELWAEELREALIALGRIRGRNLSSSAIEEIFSRFCIGK